VPCGTAGAVAAATGAMGAVGATPGAPVLVAVGAEVVDALAAAAAWALLMSDRRRQEPSPTVGWWCGSIGDLMKRIGGRFCL